MSTAAEIEQAIETLPAHEYAKLLALPADTYALGAVSNFNPQATQTFTGILYVIDSEGRQLSNVAAGAVPEPST